MTARDGGVVTGSGDSSEMGTVTGWEGKQKLMPSIDVSLTPDFRGKEESNNIIRIYCIINIMYFLCV